MLHLAAPSTADWGQQALAEIDEILLDHAHCEKKAASTALSMIFRYPEYPQLVVPMSELAREELEHFERVVALIRDRGQEFARQKPSSYASRLMTAVRSEPRARLLDTLLCASLIEARSCERMQMIARALAERGADDPSRSLAHPAGPSRDGHSGSAGEHALWQLYDSLLASEARHHATYVELARVCLGLDEAELQARLRELAEHEAEVIRTREPGRMHG